MPRRWTSKLQRWLVLTALFAGSMSAGVWAANETTGGRLTASASNLPSERSVAVVPASIAPDKVEVASRVETNEVEGASPDARSRGGTDLVFRPAPPLSQRANRTFSDGQPTQNRPLSEATRQPIVPRSRPSSFSPARLQASPTVAPSTVPPSAEVRRARSSFERPLTSASPRVEAAPAPNPNMIVAHEAQAKWSAASEQIVRWTEATSSQVRGWIASRWSDRDQSLFSFRPNTAVDEHLFAEAAATQSSDHSANITSANPIMASQTTLLRETRRSIVALQNSIAKRLEGTYIASEWENYQASLNQNQTASTQATTHRSQTRQTALWFAQLLDQAGDRLKNASNQIETWACDPASESEVCEP